MTDVRARLMGSTEVATLLGVSPATIARAVQAGRLVPSEITPGGHSRFSEKDVQAYRRNGRHRPIQVAGRTELRDLGELALRIDASISARHLIRLSQSDWRLLLGKLDELADAALDIVDPPPGATAAPSAEMAEALAALPATLLGDSVPEASAVETPQRPETAPAPEPLETTFFEDGNSGLTLVVRPIERFTLIETITGLLADVQGVGEIRLRRLQRGVAWFTVRYAGALPAGSVIPRALASLGAEVSATSERLFEVDLAPLPQVPADSAPAALAGA